MQSVILAAGLGTRLAAHLSGQPKALLPIANEFLIVRQLRVLAELGVSETIVVVRSTAATRIDRALDAIRSAVPYQLVTCESNAGFESLGHAVEFLEAEPFVLLMVDSVWLDRDVERLQRVMVRNPKNLVVSATPCIRDSKPSYVITDGEQVVDVGRHLHSSLVTAGLYLCPAQFAKEHAFAARRGIASLTDYLGFYCRNVEPGVLFTVPYMVDVDEPEDVALAEQMIVKNCGGC